MEMTRRELMSMAICILAIGPILSMHDFPWAGAAEAHPELTECFRMSSRDTPFGGEYENIDEDRSETWCYKNLTQPEGAKLIYNIDVNGETRPELTVMVERDGTLMHASLNQGKLTFHRLRAPDLNPVGAPLAPPDNAEKVSVPFSPGAKESLENGIKLFQEHGYIPVYAAKITSGTVTANVPSDSMPWRGYWFPYSTDRLHKGDDSPMAKYDKFIARRAANTNPGSQAWEKRYHNHGYGWSGHCNGWAAASVMTQEPTSPISDPFSGVTFSVADLKGLLIEQNYCPKIVFYGSRNYGKPGDNPRDIHASTFHNVLAYFIGQLKKPVLVDLMATRPVQNAVISGYTMKSTRIGTNTYSVEAKLRVHFYDDKHTEETGVAPSKTRTYRYTIRTDSSGYVRSGSWISDNPDFFWVPLAPADCGFRNKLIEQFWIDEIFRFATDGSGGPPPEGVPASLPADSDSDPQSDLP